jgi:lipoprotein-anchoring transpeptidase ErfK/SrfK
MNRKKILLVVAQGLLIVSMFVPQAAVSAQVNQVVETYAGEALCLPGAYIQDSGTCLALGPSAFLTDLAKNGAEYPFRPLSYSSPDPKFKRAPEAYLKTGKVSYPIYPSLNDAIARNHTQYLGQGNKYLAMESRVDREDGVYYLTKSGYWIEAGEADAACCIYEGRFQGLLFSKPPRTSFGWIVDQARPRNAANYSAPETGKILERETVVQIFSVVQAKETSWYMIGMNEWVERRFIRQVDINRTAPQGVEGNRWIEVNLYEQTLSVYDKGKLIFATLIASGVEPFYTRPGLFKIYKKKPLETMSGSFESDRSDYYYFEDVPNTMYFDEARALHGAYWRTLFGYAQSHGCVNLSIGDSKVLFDWANEGDWVYVWDPSGSTPTDPKFYDKGGA